METVNISPVSYTHLDVYKRQVLQHQGISHATLQPEAAVHAVRWMPRASEAGAAINSDSAVNQVDAK